MRAYIEKARSMAMLRRLLAIATTLGIIKVYIILLTIAYGFVRITAPLISVRFGPLDFSIIVIKGLESQKVSLTHVALAFLILEILSIILLVSTLFWLWNRKYALSSIAVSLLYSIDMLVMFNTRHLYNLIANKVIKLQIGGQTYFLNQPEVYSGELLAYTSFAISITLLILIYYIVYRYDGSLDKVKATPYLSILAMIVVMAVMFSGTSLQVTPPPVRPPSVVWSADGSALLIDSGVKGAVIRLVELYIIDNNNYYKVLTLNINDEKYSIKVKPLLVRLADEHGITAEVAVLRLRIYYPDGSSSESIKEIPVPPQARTVTTIGVTVDFQFAYTKITFDDLGCQYVEYVRVRWVGTQTTSIYPREEGACSIVFPSFSRNAIFEFVYRDVNNNLQSYSILLSPGTHTFALRRS